MAYIQFCIGAVYSSETGPHDEFQCNLVLSEPPGERVNLLNGMHEDFVKGYAIVIAETLGLQIIEHGNRITRP